MRIFLSIFGILAKTKGKPLESLEPALVNRGVMHERRVTAA
jgi:hypothetical protein